jgi:hypothetical protein
MPLWLLPFPNEWFGVVEWVFEPHSSFTACCNDTIGVLRYGYEVPEEGDEVLSETPSEAAERGEEEGEGEGEEDKQADEGKQEGKAVTEEAEGGKGDKAAEAVQAQQGVAARGKRRRRSSTADEGDDVREATEVPAVAGGVDAVVKQQEDARTSGQEEKPKEGTEEEVRSLVYCQHVHCVNVSGPGSEKLMQCAQCCWQFATFQNRPCHFRVGVVTRGQRVFL